VTVIRSTVGSPRREIMVSTEVLRNMFLASETPESKPTYM
jgi:hypothetical protein